jgi:4-amino-4-deoxy-L-arabinose transferase-like glycosyltransferase
MPLLECPDCGKMVSDQAEACPNCGRPVAAAARPQIQATVATLEPRPQGSPLLKFVGALLFLGGVAFEIYYLAYFDTSVAVPTTEILGQTIGGGRVNNLGLMQDRQNGLMFSSVAALAGLLLVFMADRINKPA